MFPHIIEPHAQVDDVHLVRERVTAIVLLERGENAKTTFIKIVEHEQGQVVLATQPIYQRPRRGSAQSLAGDDRKIESLGQLMSIQTQADTDGSGEISVSTTDATGSPVQLVNKANVLGSVTVSGTTVTAGSPATVLGLSGGSINGADRFSCRSWS